LIVSFLFRQKRAVFLKMLAVTVQTIGQRHDFSISGFIRVGIQDLMLEFRIMPIVEDKERNTSTRGSLNAHLVTRGHA